MRFLSCALYLAALGILSHLVGEALPRRWFDAGRFPYRTASWERGGAVYEKLGIRRWKDVAPDMSKLMPRMVPKKVPQQNTADGIDRLVRETCVAECVHAALILAGAVCLWLWPGWGGALVFAVWALAGNLPFILIQRYNRPRLVRLLARLRKNETEGAFEHARLDPDLQHG